MTPLKAVLKPGVVLLGAGVAAVLVLRVALSMPDGEMDITLLGGGQQATLLVRTPGGETLLLNGATQAGVLSSELGKRFPPLERRLGAWLLTDPSSAPLQEFDLLTQRFTPGLVYRSPSVPNSADWRRVSASLALKGVISSPLQAGQGFDLGQGARLQVLALSDNASALLLEWGRLRLVVPGGLASSELLRLAGRRNWEGCLVVLSAADLAAADAQTTWAQGRPLVVLVAGGATALPPGWMETARLGWIEAKSDGQNLWLQAGH